MPTPLYDDAKGAIFCPSEACVISSATDHTYYLVFFHMGARFGGPFKKAKGGFTHVFVVVDKFTKWVKAKRAVSYPVFRPKPSTHRMHDPGSIVPHIRPKVSTDNQMSRV
jgi:hypothetical protein